MVRVLMIFKELSCKGRGSLYVDLRVSYNTNMANELYVAFRIVEIMPTGGD